MIWRLYHRYWLGHTVDVARVSVPLWDAGARGLLYKCSCGSRYAQ